MSKKTKEYWFCLIGPVKKKDLGFGADWPLRMAVREKFIDVFGKDAETTASGWGVSEKKYEILRRVFSCSEDELDKFNI